MIPQHGENLAVLPPRGDGSVRGLEVANRLRPLARGRVACDLVARRLGVLGGWVRRGELLLLRGPVVNVPVVLVEEEVVLVEQLGGERGEVLGCECREEEVGLEGSALAGLVFILCQLPSSSSWWREEHTHKTSSLGGVVLAYSP